MSRTILHVFPSFAPGGIQMRLATVIAGLPSDWQHEVLALDGTYTAFEGRTWPGNVLKASAEASTAGSLPMRILSIRKALKAINPDILITNNWGSIEWAMAARTMRSLPFMHTESGFGPDEAFQLNAKRGAIRRFVLPGASAVLLCSQTLVKIAKEAWRLPGKRVHFVPDGIDIDRFRAAEPMDLSFRADASDQDVVVVGCVAPLRPEKNLTALLDAFHMATERHPGLRLAIAGDGSESARLHAHAAQLPCADKITFCGFLSDIERFYASVDMCALSSDTEQLPNSILQAMCAGLPIAAFDVGDIAMMVTPQNADFIVPRRDIAALSDAFLGLAYDAAKRAALGQANAQRCAADFGETGMVAAYKTHIDAALGAETV